MTKTIKIGIVIVGYILAFFGALVAVFLQWVFMGAAQGQASAGMAAFGDAILFLLVFGVLALAPTALAFFFLRPFQTFWNWFAAACLMFSLVPIVLVLANTVQNANGGYANSPTGPLLSLLGILGAFAAPVLVAGFVILAFLAPSSRARLGLLISAGLAACAGIYVLVNLFFFQRLF